MAISTVLQFMRKTADDEALRKQLEELLGVGDGDISNESELDSEESAALTGERAPIVVEFAAKNGHDFSVDELITIVSAFQKHQAGEMPDAEFAQLIGISADESAEEVQVTGPLKRLARYMSKTYLGLEAP